MTIAKGKYFRSYARIFLFVYVIFLLISIFHYHNFDLEGKGTYSQSAKSYPYTDLTADYYSVCSLHQFLQTIGDFHFSSSDIIQSLSELDSTLTRIKTKIFLTEEYSIKSPRAPPFFVS